MGAGYETGLKVEIYAKGHDPRVVLTGYQLLAKVEKGKDKGMLKPYREPSWVEKSRPRSWSVLTPDGATTAFPSLKKALAAMVPGAVCMGYEEGTLVSTCDAWPA